MYRLLIATFVALSAMPLAGGPALARVIEFTEAAAAKAMPAVVNIATWKLRPAVDPGGPPRRVKTYASGFIIDPAGIIVTNKHVIDGALDVKVLFHNGDRANGKVLAVAPMTDLAVVKVDVGRTLPELKWDDSGDIRVGDSVLAIGNPLGLGMSISAGIISALHRDIQDTPFDDYIQTDAAINHGNSGGPLVNLKGEVVGVDTALYNPDDAGGFIGIGLAISSETAQFVVRHLLDPKQPRPGWIGVKLQDLTPDLADAVGLPGSQGSIVAAVEPGGPAARAALRPGDVLFAIGNTKEPTARALMRALVEMPLGEPAHLSVWRDGKEHTVSVTVAEWPKIMPEGGVMTHLAEAMSQQAPHPGVQLAPLTDAARRQYGLDAKLRGALVASVEKYCEARDLGIVPGDVITAVLGAPVAAPGDVHRAIQKAHEERRPSLALLVEGKGGVRWVSLSISPTGSPAGSPTGP